MKQSTNATLEQLITFEKKKLLLDGYKKIIDVNLYHLRCETDSKEKEKNRNRDIRITKYNFRSLK